MKIVDAVFDASIDYFMERPLLWIAASLTGFVVFFLASVAFGLGVVRVLMWMGN